MSIEASFPVQLSSGACVPFESLYQPSGALLVFLRHLGCPFCKEQVTALRLEIGIPVFFVVGATVAEARQFREKVRSPHEIIVDAERTLAEHFGVGRASLAQLIGPKVFARGFGAILRGHWVGLPLGDIWQLPGIIHLGADGEVAWEYIGDSAASTLNAQQIRARLDIRQSKS